MATNYEKNGTPTVISDRCPVCKKQVSSFTEVCPSCGFPHLKGYGDQASKITLILKKDVGIVGSYGVTISSKNKLPVAIGAHWCEEKYGFVPSFDISAKSNGSTYEQVSFFKGDEIYVNCGTIARRVDDCGNYIKSLEVETSISSFEPNSVYEFYFKKYTYETTQFFGIIKKQNNIVKVHITQLK